MKRPIRFALSGGGLRSASFCSGVVKGFYESLHANEKERNLIFSCVSGGGYFGSGFAQRVGAFIKGGHTIQTAREEALKQLHENMKSNIGIYFNTRPKCPFRYLIDLILMVYCIVFPIIVFIIKIFPIIIFVSDAVYHIALLIRDKNHEEIRFGSLKLGITFLILFVAWVTSLGLAFILKRCNLSRKKDVENNNNEYNNISSSPCNRMVIFFYLLFKTAKFGLFFTFFTLLSVFANRVVDSSLGGLLQEEFSIALIAFQIIRFTKTNMRSAIGALDSQKYFWFIYFFIQGWVANWRLEGVKSGGNQLINLKFMRWTNYSDRLFNIFNIIAFGLIILYPFLSIIYDYCIRYYYQISLSKLFYSTTTVRTFGNKIYNYFVPCQDKFSSLDPSTNYISNVTSLFWRFSFNIKQNTSQYVASIGRFGKEIATMRIIRKEAIPNPNLIEHNGNPSYIEHTLSNQKISDYMTSSAAAITTQPLGVTPKILNFSLGEWGSNIKCGWLKCAHLFYQSLLTALIFIPFIFYIFYNYRYVFTTITWGLFGIFLFIGDIIYYAVENYSPLGGFLSPTSLALIKEIRILSRISIISKHLYSNYLSDGGHLENSGLLSLLCCIDSQENMVYEDQLNVIVMADGSEDPKRGCEDLVKVLEMARNHGYTFVIENNTKDLMDEIHEMGVNQQKGYIKFIAIKNQQKTKIYYLKSCYPADNAATSTGCCCNCCDNTGLGCFIDCCCGQFPNTSTGMQFFSTKIYEKYRNEGIARYNQIIEDENQQNNNDNNENIISITTLNPNAPITLNQVGVAINE